MNFDFDCPCKDCKSRYETCHAVCARYAEWKLRRDEECEKAKKDRYYNYITNRRRGVKK